MRFYIEIFGIVIFKNHSLGQNAEDHRKVPDANIRQETKENLEVQNSISKRTDNVRQETSTARLPKHTEPRPGVIVKREYKRKMPIEKFREHKAMTPERAKQLMLEYFNSTRSMKHVIAKREGYLHAKSMCVTFAKWGHKFNIPYKKKDYKL